MPNPESLNSNPGESTRSDNQRRGEKTYMTVRAEREAYYKELQAERERIYEELKKLQALKEELGLSQPISSESQPAPATEASPESTTKNQPDIVSGLDIPIIVPGSTPETPPNTVESESSNPSVEKAKRNSAFRKFLFGVTSLGLAAAITIGGFLPKRNANNAPKQQPTATESETDADSENEPDLDIDVDIEDESTAPNQAESKEAVHGIIDGYAKKGMWLSKNKPSNYAFASAAEVAELFNEDECEMLKYTAENQVESFADYLANLPEQLQPEGFKGLSISATEQKLEQLSDEEYSNVREQFNQIIDNAFTRPATLNGQYQNAYMRLRDENADTTHNNMELIECTTNENNVEATQFYWIDKSGNEIGNMTVKIIHNPDGSIEGCEQVVNMVGTNRNLYDGLVSIPEISVVPESGVKIIPPTKDPTPENTPTPDDTPTPEDVPTPTPEDVPTPTPEPTPEPTPTPETPPTPTPELTPKNEEAERENAGDRVDQRELNEEETPATTIEQDQENFTAIEEQKQEDEERQAEAEQTAAEQAEAESAAAEQAEERREQQAEAESQAEPSAEEQAEDERQSEAAEEAAAVARAEAEAAQRAAEEADARERQEAREQAQAEAEQAAAANEAEAASNNDARADERAEMFAGGDF